MSLRLFGRRFLAGDERIFGRGHGAMFVVTVNFPSGVQKKRAASRSAIGFWRRGKFERGIISADVRNDAVTVFVAAGSSLGEFGADQRSLLRRNLILRCGSQFCKVFGQLTKGAKISLHRFGEAA